MTQYLSPGVYIEEIQVNSKPLEGVSTSTTAILGLKTIAALGHFASGKDGSWQDRENQDSGIALLELFSWLTEQLIARPGRPPDAALPYAARLAAAALAVIADREAPPASVLQRTRFFPGRQLDNHGRIIDANLPEPHPRASSDQMRMRRRDEPS